ncbi:hypothetical protein HDU98_007635, partial [Podochytrium sp. JEL0797]
MQNVVDLEDIESPQRSRPFQRLSPVYPSASRDASVEHGDRGYPSSAAGPSNPHSGGAPSDSLKRRRSVSPGEFEASRRRHDEAPEQMDQR